MILFFILFYCLFSYLFAVGCKLADSTMPWALLLLAPIIMPVALGYATTNYDEDENENLKP